jgi:ketosteroid isomerase-like protein
MKKLLAAITIIAFFWSCTVSKKTAANPSAEIIQLMHQSSADWNKADLDAFMALYDTASTFMFSTGPVGLGKMKANYEKGFFKDGKPIQQLRFEDLEVRALGAGHALLTGKFVLSGNNLPDRKGIYTLVFVKRSSGWKILHDHSS